MHAQIFTVNSIAFFLAGVFTGSFNHFSPRNLRRAGGKNESLRQGLTLIIREGFDSLWPTGLQVHGSPNTAMCDGHYIVKYCSTYTKREAHLKRSFGENGISINVRIPIQIPRIHTWRDPQRVVIAELKNRFAYVRIAVFINYPDSPLGHNDGLVRNKG